MPLDQSPILRVGIDDAPPIPVQMGSPESEDFRGYEVSLLDALAESLGFTLQYRKAPWSVIVNELSAGTLDAVCSAATITPERAREVDFCTPHLEIALAAVVRKNASTSIDWQASRFGVRAATTAQAYVAAQTGRKGVALRSESNDELYGGARNREDRRRRG
jgi:ABC-type amino acid transport substrate-binding protein